MRIMDSKCNRTQNTQHHAASQHHRALSNFSLSFTMTTFLLRYNDLEIQEAMDISEGLVDALDEEEKMPIDESVSTIISDLSPSDWF
jgi:hypothetical protein